MREHLRTHFAFSCAAAAAAAAAALGTFSELPMAPSILALLSCAWPVAAPLISSPCTFRPRPAPTPPALLAASSHQCVAQATETSRGSAPALASILVAGACAAAFAFTSTSQLGAAYAAEGASENSTSIFQRSCAGCHAGGGNILQPNATLFAKDLDRNGMANVDDVFQITYFGKGRMPGYGEKCTPRGQCTFGPRLSDADIRTLAEFVRLQADQGWPS